MMGVRRKKAIANAVKSLQKRESSRDMCINVPSVIIKPLVLQPKKDTWRTIMDWVQTNN